MNVDLEQKILKLRERYNQPEDTRLIDEIETSLRKKIARAELAEQPIVIDLVNDTIKKISEINLLLAYDKTFNEPTPEAQQKRQALFYERAAHEFWLGRFDPTAAARAVDRLENFVDKKLDA